MSRSGYSENGDYLDLYRNSVERAINGKRGQAFLVALAKALDDLPEKKLISAELLDESGQVCAIGAYCKAKGIDVSGVDIEDPFKVGKLVGIAQSMAAEIEYENDERREGETPEQRWVRMRAWVQRNLKDSEIKGGDSNG